MKCLLRCLFVLTAGVMLPLLLGCTEKIPLLEEDILGHVWLLEAAEKEGVKGFYATEGGQLRLINQPDTDGMFWEIHENQLLLWLRNKDQANLRLLEYYPLLIEEKLFLATSLEPGSPIYSATSPHEPLGNVQYVPILLNDSTVKNPAITGAKPYLQLDTADKSLRGYGGVNNFHGSYQRTGPVGFEAGPMAATRMSGPGMDYELMFMQCLDRADALIAVDQDLFFYQGAQLVCSLRAN